MKVAGYLVLVVLGLPCGLGVSFGVSLTMRVGQLLYSLDAAPQNFGTGPELLAAVRATLAGVQDDAERARFSWFE